MAAASLFPKGYRSVVMVSLGVPGATRTDDVFRIINKHLSEAERRHLYFGTCFGRYDMLYDFRSDYAKVASYKATQIQKSMSDPAGLNIGCSTSLLLCKILDGKGKDTGSPIRAYTFLRPKEDYLPVREASLAISDVVDGISSTCLLWNLSIFPLIIVLDGESLPSIFKALGQIRKKLEDLLFTTNTIVSLGFKRIDKTEADSITAITHVKTKGIDEPDWKIDQFGFQGYLGAKLPVELTGWFDYCLTYRGNSLAEFHRDLFALIREYGGRMLQSTTTFLDVR